MIRSFRRVSPWAALLLILALFAIFQLQSGGDKAPLPQPTTEAGSVVQVFFSRPWDPMASTFRGGPDADLAQAIDAAQFSVDMAIYRLDLWSLRDALLDAHRRGVKVRLVIESSNAGEDEIKTLISAGIPVKGDQRDSLMHHKFTVIDGYDVWTGSMNYTVNGAYLNDNNLIRVRSSAIGTAYTREFEEMFTEGRFGALSLADAQFFIGDVEDIPVTVLFSPDDGVAMQLVELLRAARERIDMLAFSLTSDGLGAALLQAHQRGVAVRIVMEQDQAANAGSEAGRLRAGGIDVRFDTNPNAMHHKVIIIDGEHVVTGSYNFSRNAEQSNDENVLILQHPGLAGQYLVEFNRIYDQADTEPGGRAR